MKASINLSNLIIPSIKLPSGAMSATKTVDLSGLQGRSVRVYLSSLGAVEINPPHDSYWLIAESVLPPPATQQVQVGTHTETAATPSQVVRGTGATDTVTLAAGQRIGQVGFSWQPYVLGTDYTVSVGAIAWLANRKPKAGDQYAVEILTDTTVPTFEQRVLPLDLAAHPVTLFDLPL